MNREVWQITSRGEWLDRRRSLLTASRIAALFDAHPYLSREQLGGTMTGAWSEGDNAAMRRGRILESAVVEALREEHPGWAIERATTFHSIPECRLGATPDAFFTDEDGERGLIQIKTADPEVWQRWNGRPPLAYQLQTLTEMMCCDLDRGLLAVMITNRSLPVYEFTVPRHPAAEAKLLEAAAAWWQEWDAGRIAPAAPSDGLQEALDDGSSIDLSADNYLCSALPERQALKAEISAREKRCAEIDAHLKAAMGAATYASLPGWWITYRAHQRAERLVPAATIRALRISATKEEESI
jgi:predicted phage-related endonuclease